MHAPLHTFFCHEHLHRWSFPPQPTSEGHLWFCPLKWIQVPVVNNQVMNTPILYNSNQAPNMLHISHIRLLHYWLQGIPSYFGWYTCCTQSSQKEKSNSHWKQVEIQHNINWLIGFFYFSTDVTTAKNGITNGSWRVICKPSISHWEYHKVATTLTINIDPYMTLLLKVAIGLHKVTILQPEAVVSNSTSSILFSSFEV